MSGVECRFLFFYFIARMIKRANAAINSTCV